MPTRVDSPKVDASPLGKPLHFEFSGKTAQNRLLKAAMTERLSSWDPKNFSARGVPSKELLNVYKRWGEGGYGQILTGNLMIAYDHLEAAGNPIIAPDNGFEGERFEAFKQLATFAKAHGSLIVGQVSHPGRQVADTIQKHPVSASDVQLEGEVIGMTFAKPRAATQDDIDDIVRRFTHAAEYLHKAGYDGIQLHGAHGYLLAQFLSPTTNLRTDKYGGSLENRARIIIEIAQSIRSRVPASSGFMLGIKINSVEFQKGGFSDDEAKELCQLLEKNEFDYVELSGGTYQSLAFAHKRDSTRKREAFFLDFAERIVKGLNGKTKTYITGGFKSTEAMVAALDTVDGVGMARAACQEPRIAKDLVDGKVSSVIDQKVDQDNFGLTNVIAGSQIRQVGRDKEPIDMSVKENVDAFMKDMGQWGQKMAEDAGKLNVYGYVDIESVKADAYGTTA
ncbi:NADH oxidase [Cyphellophora attinorum]|uniref:NADH oxidase n=1 Tax=Cyphellophora attinorum TaxID=1664694 RepID=A0A0N0NJT7_9EURO|nr:NADH oxidase [Phialophora attinorum]KPI37029.1 NADH oxidase [Phialophora attinorum]